MKRVAVLYCWAYHVPQLSRVAIFPLHMDPPTIQHREIFRLLLGQTLDSEHANHCQNCAGNTRAASSNHLSTSSSLTSSQSEGRRAHRPHCALDVDTPLSRYWYLESFARALQTDSQLTPFEDIILVPNTRYPVGLRRSTHLAALAIMATQDMPKVHVDFTALEHPDESMPIVYALTRHYPNSVLVHSLQDAYEMQNWRRFAEIKMEVPILFLQTKSLPIKMLKHPPSGALTNDDDDDTSRRKLSRHAKRSDGAARRADDRGDDADEDKNSTARDRLDQSEQWGARGPEDDPSYHGGIGRRQYHNADALTRLGGVSHSPDEHMYYAHVSRALESAAKRRHECDCHRVRGWANDVEGSLDLPATRDDAEHVPATLQEGHIAVQLPKKADAHVANATSSPNPENATATPPRHAWPLVTGEWWRTRGGRGDDEVEASRTYHSFSGSAWLVAPYSAAEEPETEMAWVVDGDADAHADQGTVCGSGEWNSEDVVVTSEGSVVVRRRCHTKQKKTKSETATTRTNGHGKNEDGDGDDADELEDADRFLESSTFADQLEHVSQELDDLLQPENADAVRRRVGAASAASNTSSKSEGQGVPQPSSSHHRPRKASQRHHHRRPPRTQRRVRELIEELFPPSLYGHHPKGCFVYKPASPDGQTPSPCADDHNSTTTRTPRAPNSTSSSAYSSFYSSSGTPAAGEDRFLWHDKGPGTDRCEAVVGDASFSDSPRPIENETMAPVAPSEYGDLLASTPSSPHPTQMDRPLIPMIEVLPVVRTTGADVRQALWEQTMDPSCLLTARVLRYAESHDLYRDTRKASHAAQYYTATGQGAATGQGTAGNAANAMIMGSGNSALGGYAGIGSALRRRSSAPRESATMFLSGIIPRLELHYDKNNLLAREQYEKLKVFQCHDGQEPDLIVPIGGDGYMMHCIRKNWRRFIPFYGVNAGHVGYLLNDCATMEELFAAPLKLHTTNMLYCQAEKETATGERVVMAELAFNDAWLERSSGQTALIRILVNGEERIHRLRGDGVLVSTAAGSTAYSQALGASPVPVSAPLIQVVGSNVVSPAQWRPAHLDQEDQVELEVIDTVKRPCRCFVDSVDVGQVTRMLVRSSRIAGVTLAFSTSCDLQHKLYQMQFPRTL